MLADLKMSQQRYHPRPEHQADDERGYGRPRGAKCYLLEYLQKRKFFVKVLQQI
jgi:hypothetical protein